MNPLSECHNSKWQIQYVGRKKKKKSRRMVKIYTEGFLGSLIMNQLSDFYTLKKNFIALFSFCGGHFKL